MSQYDPCLENGIWSGIIQQPLPGRVKKPRNCGITMVMDKGMGLSKLNDLLTVSGEYIDLIKFTHGTSTLQSPVLLQEKVEIIKSNSIDVMPGGTLLEAAIFQGAEDAFLKKAAEIGFTVIEVSDATLPISETKKANTVKKALDLGFKVITEVGIKDPDAQLPIKAMAEQMDKELELGVAFVIMDATEFGMGVGIYDINGQIRQDYLDEINEVLGSKISKIMWEAPSKGQQALLIRRFGNNVNLGNIQPDEIIPVESLRRGYRTDTLKMAYIG